MWDKLYTVSVQLFTENGYDETSIGDITERADVARGTFFNYFDRKEDVIAAWSARRRATLRTELREVVADGTDVATCLVDCMRRLARINTEDWPSTRVMVSAWVRSGQPIAEEPYASSLFTEVINAGIESGDIAPGTDVVLVGHLLRDLYLGALYRYIGSEAVPESLEDELSELTRTVLRGLLVPDSAVRVG
jgi:AcrR family transcriptional regulator